MTRFMPQWLQDATYPASVDRRIFSALFPGPAVRGGAVRPTAGMGLQVDAGQAAIPAPNGTGSVLCTWDAPEIVTLDPSPPSGTNRMDLVVVTVTGADIGAGSVDEFLVTKIRGAEGSLPSPPAVPPGSVALAQVAVSGGVASVTAANVTDRRIQLGRPLDPPMFTGAEPRGVASCTDQNGDVWVAKASVNGGRWMRATDALHVRVGRSAAWTTSTTYIPFGFDTSGDDLLGLFDFPAMNAMIPVDGLYKCAGQLQVWPNQFSTLSPAIMRDATEYVATGTLMAANAGSPLTVPLGNTHRFAKGATVALFQAASEILNGQASGWAVESFLTIDYIGKGA